MKRLLTALLAGTLCLCPAMAFAAPGTFGSYFQNLGSSSTEAPETDPAPEATPEAEPAPEATPEAEPEAATEPAVAGEPLTITDERFVEIPEAKYAYFYARIENTGTEPIILDRGKFAAYDDAGTLILSDDYVGASPSGVTLQPGEHIFINKSFWEDVLEGSDVATYQFNITTVDTSWYNYITLPAEAELAIEGPDSYNNRVLVKVTNDQDFPLYNSRIVIALYDVEGNLLNVNEATIYSVYILPGSSIVYEVSYNSDLVRYYADNNLEIGSAEAIVYQEIEG